MTARGYGTVRNFVFERIHGKSTFKEKPTMKSNTRIDRRLLAELVKDADPKRLFRTACWPA